MPVQMRPAQVDFSGLAKIGENFGDMRRDQRLEKVLSSVPRGPNGEFDWDGIATTLMQSGFPEEGMKVAQSGAMLNYKQGMLGVAETKAADKPLDERIYDEWNANRQPPAAPKPMQLGQTGGESSLSAGVPGYSLAQASGIEEVPSAVANKLWSPGKLKEQEKLGEGAAKKIEDKPTDWALANSFDEKLNLLEGNIKSLLDPNGNPTDGLRSITGNYELNGVDTKIPNSYLLNVTEKARDAHNTLQTSVIEIGLNALAEMRAASAQGASGMGQLAIQESEWLQQSLAALQESNSPEQMAANLQKVLDHTKRLRAAMQNKFQMKHGEQWQPAPDPDAPIIGSPREPGPDPDMAQLTPGAEPRQVTQDPRGGYFNPPSASEGALIANIKRAISAGKMTKEQAIAILKSKGIEVDESR